MRQYAPTALSSLCGVEHMLAATTLLVQMDLSLLPTAKLSAASHLNIVFSNPMQNKNLLKGIGVAVLGVLIIGIAGASAMPTPGTFMDKLAYFAGIRLGDNLAEQVKHDVSVSLQSGDPQDSQFYSEQREGAAGDTYSLPKVAQSIVATSTAVGVTQLNSASTTYGQMLNPTRANGGRTRYLTRLLFVSQDSSGTYLSGSLIMDFNTSTNQYASNTVPIASNAFTTSTQPVELGFNMSSTTLTAVNQWKHIWNPGEFLNCTTNRITSSTYGTCYAEYLTLD